jgi:small conductance mechanosensitive channel
MAGAATTSMIDRRQRIETLTRVTASTARAVIWTTTILAVLADIGVAIGPLLAGVSIAGVALAFGAQSIVKDFFSGFFILLENQYDVGDTIAVGSVTGTVERMSMRITVIRDSGGTAHFIPNSAMNNVANKTYGWARPTVEAVFSPGVPVQVARDVLTAAAARASQEPAASAVLLEPIRVDGPTDFTAAGVTWRLIGRTSALRAPEAKRAMIAALSTELSARGLSANEGAFVVKKAG